MMDTTPSSSKQNESNEAALSYGCVKVENNDDKERKLKGKLNIEVKKNDISYICQTDGKERVLDMIMKKFKKDQQISVFQSVLNRSCLVNLGLPTGVLDESVTYECRMHRRKQGDEKLMRKFDVAIFDDSWDIKYFYVKISEKGRKLPAVSSMAQFADILQVPFFNGEETYFEALVRDRRFDKIKDDGNLKIGSCHFEYEKKSSDVELKDDASPSEICFEFHRRKGTMLISGDVKQLTCPSALLEQPCELVIKKEPPETPSGKLDQHQASLTQESSGQPNATSVGTTVESGVASAQVPDQSLSVHGSNSVAKKRILPTVEEFEIFMQCNFNIKVRKEQPEAKEKERQKEIEKFVQAGYKKFALNHNFSLRSSDVKKLDQLLDSTGAIVMVLTSGERKVVGTCFRVGSKYVITNWHVYKIIKDYDTKKMLQYAAIDFCYTTNLTSFIPKFLCNTSVISESEELDYVIFEPVIEPVIKPNSSELPKSVTSFFTIPSSVERAQEGMFLTFSGHPDGSCETITDLMCPLRSTDTLDKRYVISLSQKPQQDLFDQRRQTYDVSTFYHGASGSPGVLLQHGYLLVLHCGGFWLLKSDGKVHYIIEQGILMAVIVEDVKAKYGVQMAEELFDLQKPGGLYQVTELS